jgi:hypothetical protein
MKRHRLSFLSAFLASVLMLAMAGCTKSQNSAADAASVPDDSAPSSGSSRLSGQVPASLNTTFQNAGQTYDAVVNRDWESAATRLDALKSAISQVHSDLKPVTNENDARADGVSSKLNMLDLDVMSLSDALRAHDHDSALRKANEITMPIADLALMYSSKIPGDLMRLKYYGRELDIAAATDDASTVRDSADQVLKIWKELRPAVEAAGGQQEAQQFNDLVDRMEQNNNPSGELGGLLKDRTQAIQDVLNRGNAAK